MGGNGTLLLAGCMFVALALLAFLQGSLPPTTAQTGICLPPPQQWPLTPWGSFLLNGMAVILSALLCVTLNRRFNFIPDTSVIFAAVLLVSACAVPALLTRLNSSSLLLLANVLSLQLLFGQYDRSKVSVTPIFLIGTIFSIGSMFHYSFLFFIVIYGCAAAVLKTFGLRGFPALLLGMVAPYWIVLGLGIVPLSALRVPVAGVIWQASLPGSEMIWVIAATALTAFAGLMMALRNAVSMRTAPTAIRAFNTALTLPALCCLLLSLIDWENFTVYFLSICLFTGFESGYLNAFERKKYNTVIFWCFALFAIFVNLTSIYQWIDLSR